MRRAAALAAAGALAALFAASAAAGEEPVQLKPGKGRELTSSRCITCHSLDYIPANAPVLDRAGWQKTVQKMRERFGAPISDEEARSILEYLAASYGKS
jgi:mono/diheme cytochrome c family protein